MENETMTLNLVKSKFLYDICDVVLSIGRPFNNENLAELEAGLKDIVENMYCLNEHVHNNWIVPLLFLIGNNKRTIFVGDGCTATVNTVVKEGENMFQILIEYRHPAPENEYYRFTAGIYYTRKELHIDFDNSFNM